MNTSEPQRRYFSAAIYLIFLLALPILNSGCSSQYSLPVSTTQAAPEDFVTRSGSQLLLNDRPFRFAGANLHWLALDDEASYPSHFRVDDGLDAAKEMGASVIRAHTLGISTGCGSCIEPSLGIFNETAFAHVDYAMKAARDRGLRLIIPLTDNWHFVHGGKHTFTDWRGISDENQFYFDNQVIEDFETYINTLLNHVNTLTGIAYKDDPTTLAWETGNEIDPPYAWTQTISMYIKQLDPHHLVLDGSNGVDPSAASLTSVDMFTNHYYPMSISKLTLDANTANRLGKAFIVGEFDWNSKNTGDSLRNFLSTIETNPAVAGDLFWELWPHDDRYGYVSGQPEFTLHYPGDTPQMRERVRQLRVHAYAMRHQTTPADSTPGVPLIDGTGRGEAGNILFWRGTAVAASYSIERSTSSEHGPWTLICDKCTLDAPWEDRSPPKGDTWYRVTAYNLAGTPSKPSSPYKLSSLSWMPYHITQKAHPRTVLSVLPYV